MKALEYWSRVRVNMCLNSLSISSDTIENLLITKRKELEESTSLTDEQASQLTRDEQGKLYNRYIDEDIDLYSISNVLRSSLFVSCYSLLEHELLNLCELLQGLHEYSIKLDDLRGRGILKAQAYLKKVVGITFPDQTPSWKDIVAYNHIRNLIVHNDGVLDNNDNSEKAESFIKGKTSVTLKPIGKYKRIQFSKDFC
ncbi:hypothetical protein HY605_01875, partial [Candidatus Peregrinibacteria bacterium]|nr:hypothetical protein [Candidatus Peregrinibacteria bacterium]